MEESIIVSAVSTPRSEGKDCEKYKFSDDSSRAPSPLQEDPSQPVPSSYNKFSDEEEDMPFKKVNKRTTRFSDSESDNDKENDKSLSNSLSGSTLRTAVKDSSTSEDSDTSVKSGQKLIKPTKKIKRIVNNFSDSDSDASISKRTATKRSQRGDSDSGESKSSKPLASSKVKSRLKTESSSDSSNEESVVKNAEQQLRMKNKRQKLKDKFKNLMKNKNGKSKENEVRKNSEDEMLERVNNDIVNSSESSSSHDEEGISVAKNKQEAMEKSIGFNSSLCDPDTSDEESSQRSQPKVVTNKKKTKLTSPKPQRMTAKQAMENMQKIKSESNRMLREKEVSLPYHRPKALSLKDIMNKRKPAVTADGKALPIKMNSEQLQQYVSLLEQRQKEMMELCKSESEDEEEQSKEQDLTIQELPKEDTKNHELQCTDLEELPVACVDTNSALVEQKENIQEKLQEETTNDGSNCDDKVNEPNIVVEAEKQDHEDSSNQEEKNIKSLNPCEVTDSENNELLKVTQNQAESSVEVHKEENIPEHQNSTKIDNVEKSEERANISIEKADINVEKSVENQQSDSFNQDSEMISLHYEHTENTELDVNVNKTNNYESTTSEFDGEEADKTFDEMMKNATQNSSKIQEISENQEDDDCFGDDIDMQEIDNIIENAEIIRDSTSNFNSPMLIKDSPSLNIKPKITGAPGMIIDLDGNDPIASRKLTGLELLKERFVYFAKLKTPEELERAKEKRIQPGIQFLKLKHELEEKIAEQRSLEWAKRLEEEKQHQKEMKEVMGDGSDDDGDDIDKMEAKLEENGVEEESSSESEEEPEENDVILEDKPKKRNPMVDDEAEESENEEENDKVDSENGNVENEEDCDADSESEDSSEESSEEEIEQCTAKKGRILKAFEDSDDEAETKPAEVIDKLGDNVGHDFTENDINVNEKNNREDKIEKESLKQNSEPLFTDDTDKTINTKHVLDSPVIKDSQDDDLQLAQHHKSAEDLNTSNTNIDQQETSDIIDESMSTQSFSIMTSKENGVDKDLPSPSSMDINFKMPSTFLSETQPCSNSLDAVVGMCSGSFSQSLIGTQTVVSATQEIGDDVLALCTGQFYDNQFVSLLGERDAAKASENVQNTEIKANTEVSKPDETKGEEQKEQGETQATDKVAKDNVLESVLDELDGPDFDALKPSKYFPGTQNSDKEVVMKKRLVIDSDEEVDENPVQTKKKRFKKKKPEKRALQISDDEDESELEEMEQESDVEDDTGAERIVEYDSEENEVEVVPQPKKIKKKASEFLEKEAELTSEDEWVGSGDEDERGLDRMEREDGDDDVFEQGKLQKELGQIHMRDVLDQDKREVRLIQELLFEDGDLGGGGRQRKFRWRNDDGEEETGTRPDDWADTQEEEFESEEMWRKQRHERELFLRQMQEKDDTESSPNVTFNRTSLIKASLYSKTLSPPKEEPNKSTVENMEKEEEVNVSREEKKNAKDEPSPKKPFSVFQKNYHGSFLSRGNGALARLCALATPLAGDDDSKVATLGPSTHRNFVFATVSPKQDKPKVTIKRKADSNSGTPKLIKKLKTAVDASPLSKSSLMDTLTT